MYQDDWSREASKFFDALHGKQQERVRRAVQAICENPVSGANSEALRGILLGKRRVRIGNLRLIYSFDQSTQILRVWTLAPRKDVYR